MDPLTLTGVVKKYPGFTLDVSLSVRQGLVTGFIGANGAGKTTSIKAALGLIHPDAGSVKLIDKERIGVVFDQPHFNPTTRVGDLVKALNRFYSHVDNSLLNRMLAEAGITPDKRIHELSRGMGMQFQLAVALSHQPDVLILDEPTSGLDPHSRDRLLERLSTFMLDDTHSILFSSHITSDLELLADYIVFIDHGTIREDLDKESLIEKYRMISGGPAELSPALAEECHGLRTTDSGWTGLIPTTKLAQFPTESLLIEAPSLDDIAVRLMKENSHA